MCGIIGSINLDLSKEEKKASLNLMSHRGPDDRHFYEYKNDKYSLFFGHNRLEILDISNGKQPMISGDNQFVVVFNGEIYNFNELRKELESVGHKFKTTHSDTEVLIHGYKEWGENLPLHLNGMWAFAIFDKRRNRLFLSRDRYGEKPLFYYVKNNVLIFASELSGVTNIKKNKFELNKLNLKKYCAYGYFPFNLTPYNNIFKLQGGHNILFNLDTMTYNLKKYWEYLIEPDYSKTENEWSEIIANLLEESVKKRLVADVPVGVFLSGGLDSSIISLLAQNNSNSKINTFSINFSEKTFDESKYSNYFSKKIGSNHYHQVVGLDNIEDICAELFSKIDEPLSDSSLISYYLLTKFAQKKIKVALGGDAADELFAGYDTFKAINYANIMKILKIDKINPFLRFLTSKMPTKYGNMNLKFKFNRFLRFKGGNLGTSHPNWLSPLDSSEISELFNEKTNDTEIFSEAIELWEKNKSNNNIDKSLEFYCKLFLQDQILVKTDRLSMMHGLEVRSPFLDYNLTNEIRKIPSKFKLNNNISKYILKRTYEKKLGKDFTYRKKMGFTAPISKWLLDESKNFSIKSKYLTNKTKLFDNKLKEHRSFNNENRVLIWNIMNLDNFLLKNNF
jgi:asparagine synthase (glutamine-hydrolysing)